MSAHARSAHLSAGAPDARHTIRGAPTHRTTPAPSVMVRRDAGCATLSLASTVRGSLPLRGAVDRPIQPRSRSRSVRGVADRATSPTRTRGSRSSTTRSTGPTAAPASTASSTSGPRPSGIVAVADDGRLLLVGQHRYALDDYSWEIPEGGVAEGESLLEGARRELREETGFDAADWRQLCRISVSNSVTDERGAIFVATGLRAGPGDARRDRGAGAALGDARRGAGGDRRGRHPRPDHDRGRRRVRGRPGPVSTMTAVTVLRVFSDADGRGGNPLGVVLDGRACRAGRRQAVAAELGYSETVFVDDAAERRDPDLHAGGRARVRRPPDRRHGLAAARPRARRLGPALPGGRRRDLAGRRPVVDPRAARVDPPDHGARSCRRPPRSRR